MAAMTGRVTCVRVSELVGFTTLMDAAGERETFALWRSAEGSAFEQITRSMWVSFLREALINGLSVTIIRSDDNATVTDVQLGDTQ